MQPIFNNLIFTDHALKRLYQRQISQSDAWYTFKHPDKVVSTKKPGTKKFLKIYGSQQIELIGRLNDKNEWVIISCWSKNKGTGKPIFNQVTLIEKIIDKLIQCFLGKRKKTN